MLTSDNGFSVWLEITRTSAYFNHLTPRVSVNAAGITTVVAEVPVTGTKLQFTPKFRLCLNKAPGFSCLCLVVSSTVRGRDVHEGTIFMSNADVETSTLCLQREKSARKHLRQPRCQPESTNPNMGSIRLEIYKMPDTFGGRNPPPDFIPQSNPSNIFVFQFRCRQLDDAPLISGRESSHDDGPPAKRTRRGAAEKNAMAKEEEVGVSLRPRAQLRVSSTLSPDRSKMATLSQPRRYSQPQPPKGREPSIIYISSDSEEEVERPPVVRTTNRRGPPTNYRLARLTGSRGRGAMVSAKLQAAQAKLARENKRQEDLQLQMAECIQEKAERKRRENEKLAAEIEAERNLM